MAPTVEPLQDRIDKIRKSKQYKSEEERQVAIEKATELFNAETEQAAENAKLNGVGLRNFVSVTKGKGSMVVKWKGFDLDDEKAIPKDFNELMPILRDLGITEDSEITRLTMRGANEKWESEAADPVSEYIVDSWAPEMKAAFRFSARNNAKLFGQSIDEAASALREQMKAAGR